MQIVNYKCNVIFFGMFGVMDAVGGPFALWQGGLGSGHFLKLPILESKCLIIVFHVCGSDCCYVNLLVFQLAGNFDNIVVHKFSSNFF